MGEFVAASAVVGSSIEAVRGAIDQILASPDASELFESESLKTDELVFATGERGVTVLYHGFFTGYADLSRELSSLLRAPVFALHIHDGDLWMYEFFASGRLVDQFNPWPRYWTPKLKQGDVDKWAGNAAALCAHLPDVPLDSIEKYLLPWEDPSGALVRTGKAYPDDRFPYGDSWQLLDFMSRLGLVLPDPPPEPEPDPDEVSRRSQHAQGRELLYLRTTAESAWQAKRYREVVEIYSTLDAELSEIERRKLEYARKKLPASPEQPAVPQSNVAQRSRKPWWKFW